MQTSRLANAAIYARAFQVIVSAGVCVLTGIWSGMQINPQRHVAVSREDFAQRYILAFFRARASPKLETYTCARARAHFATTRSRNEYYSRWQFDRIYDTSKRISCIRGCE